MRVRHESNTSRQLLREEIKTLRLEMNGVRTAHFELVKQLLIKEDSPLLELAQDLGHRFSHYSRRQVASALAIMSSILNSDGSALSKNARLFRAGFSIMIESETSQGRTGYDQQILWEIANLCLLGTQPLPRLLIHLLSDAERQAALRALWHEEKGAVLYADMLTLVITNYHTKLQALIEGIFRRDPQMVRDLDAMTDRLGKAKDLTQQSILLHARQLKFRLREPIPTEERELAYEEAENLFGKGQLAEALKTITPYADEAQRLPGNRTEPIDDRTHVAWLEEDTVIMHAIQRKDEMESDLRYWQLEAFGDANVKTVALFAQEKSATYSQFSDRQREIARLQLSDKTNRLLQSGASAEVLNRARLFLTGLWISLPTNWGPSIYPLLLQMRRATYKTRRTHVEKDLLLLIKNCAGDFAGSLLVDILNHASTQTDVLWRFSGYSKSDYWVIIDLLAEQYGLTRENDVKDLLRKQTSLWELDFLDDVEERLGHWRNVDSRIPYKNHESFREALDGMAKHMRDDTGQTGPAFTSPNTTYIYRVNPHQYAGFLLNGPAIVHAGSRQLKIRKTYTGTVVFKDDRAREYAAVGAKRSNIHLGNTVVNLHLDKETWLIIQNVKGQEPIFVEVPAPDPVAINPEIVAHNLFVIKINSENHNSREISLQMDKNGRLQEIKRRHAVGDTYVTLSWDGSGKVEVPEIHWLVKENSSSASEDKIKMHGVHANLQEAIRLYNTGGKAPQGLGKGEFLGMVPALGKAVLRLTRAGGLPDWTAAVICGTVETLFFGRLLVGGSIYFAHHFLDKPMDFSSAAMFVGGFCSSFFVSFLFLGAHAGDLFYWINGKLEQIANDHKTPGGRDYDLFMRGLIFRFTFLLAFVSALSGGLSLSKAISIATLAEAVVHIGRDLSRVPLRALKSFA